MGLSSAGFSTNMYSSLYKEIKAKIRSKSKSNSKLNKPPVSYHWLSHLSVLHLIHLLRISVNLTLMCRSSHFTWVVYINKLNTLF